MWAYASQLRTLFCHLLLFCDVTNPMELWENAWQKMADDYQMALHRAQTQTSIFVDDFSLKDYVLTEIERLLNSSIPSKSLIDFHLPLPSNVRGRSIQNRLLLEERSYDRTMLHNEHAIIVT